MATRTGGGGRRDQHGERADAGQPVALGPLVPDPAQIGRVRQRRHVEAVGPQGVKEVVELRHGCSPP
ncbi:MAG: hypothetical protein J2P15_15105, partial [Micromonosporaceae bacterium]|nr:hypothetical protein [Micromonosporaceae bacterium]